MSAYLVVPIVFNRLASVIDDVGFDLVALLQFVFILESGNLWAVNTCNMLT